MIKKFSIFIGSCLSFFLLWMLWNMFQFSSKQINIPLSKNAEIDSIKAINNLSKSITYKTISFENPSELDSTEFLLFNQFLRDTYPLTFSTLEERNFSKYSILLKWNGSQNFELNPILLMAHSDVVPIENLDDWTEAPFAGLIKDNHIIGRGAIDDKSSLISILESIEYLLSQNFIPNRDIYVSIGHDEENTGKYGNAIISETLRNEGVYFDMILDEGSIVSDGIVKGVDLPVAMIGIAEKGYASFELVCNYKAGHSSMPGKITTIGKLTKAINRLQNKPMNSKIIKPIKKFFDYLGPEMSLKDRFFISNMSFFKSTITSRLEDNSVTAAMIRTTMAPTIISGGFKSNALPETARAVINCRIRQGNSVEKIKKHIVKTINDPDIIVNILENDFVSNPSKVSSVMSLEFDIIHKTIKEIFKEVIVAPGLVVATTDSRHYQDISKNIYRFMPITLNEHDISMIHGKNERISKESYLKMIQFYIQFIKNIHDQ